MAGVTKRDFTIFLIPGELLPWKDVRISCWNLEEYVELSSLHYLFELPFMLCVGLSLLVTADLHMCHITAL